jgi:hypothetical protein
VQVFCVLLWCMDAYLYYSVFTLGMLVVFECTVVFQRMRTLSDLRAIQVPKQHVQVGLWCLCFLPRFVPKTRRLVWCREVVSRMRSTPTSARILAWHASLGQVIAIFIDLFTSELLSMRLDCSDARVQCFRLSKCPSALSLPLVGC